MSEQSTPLKDFLNNTCKEYECGCRITSGNYIACKNCDEDIQKEFLED